MALWVGGPGREFGGRVGPFRPVERRCPWVRRVGFKSFFWFLQFSVELQSSLCVRNNMSVFSVFSSREWRVLTKAHHGCQFDVKQPCCLRGVLDFSFLFVASWPSTVPTNPSPTSLSGAIIVPRPLAGAVSNSSLRPSASEVSGSMRFGGGIVIPSIISTSRFVRVSPGFISSSNSLLVEWAAGGGSTSFVWTSFVATSLLGVGVSRIIVCHCAIGFGTRFAGGLVGTLGRNAFRASHRVQVLS